MAAVRYTLRPVVQCISNFFQVSGSPPRVNKGLLPRYPEWRPATSSKNHQPLAHPVPQTLSTGLPFCFYRLPREWALELPSSYSPDYHHCVGLDALSRFEYEIRLGRAYDSIDDIRTAIHIYNASSREKQTQVFGQRPITRAQAILSSLKNDIRKCAKEYRSLYVALLALGLPQNSELRPIGDDELWGKDMTSTSKEGDWKRKEPWYWVIGKPKDLSDGAWELERKCPFIVENCLWNFW